MNQSQKGGKHSKIMDFAQIHMWSDLGQGEGVAYFLFCCVCVVGEETYLVGP